MKSGSLQKVFQDNNSFLLASVSCVSVTGNDMSVLINITDITNPLNSILLMSTSMIEGNGSSCYSDHISQKVFYSVSDIKGLFAKSMKNYSDEVNNSISEYIQLTSLKLSGLIQL